GDAALEPTRTVTATRDAVRPGVRVDLVMGLTAPPFGGRETVADLDTLHRLHAHQRARESGVETTVPVHVGTEPRRQSVGDHFDHAAHGVTRLPHLLDLGDHRVGGLLPESAYGALVDGRQVLRLRQRSLGGLRPTDRHDVADDLDTQQLPQEGPRHRPQSRPGRGLPRTGTFQHRPGLVEAVLEHAWQIGVAGTRTSQRRVTGQPLQFGGIHRIGGHHLLPLGPLSVVDLDRDRTTLGDPVSDTAEELDAIGLESHPRAPSETEPSSGQLLGHLVRRDLHAGHHAFEDGGEGGAMRFTSGYPTQHIANVVTHRKSRVSCPYPPRPTRPETSPPHRWPTAVPDRVARPFATAENRPALPLRPIPR